MAKLSNDTRSAIESGYQEGERVMRAYGCPNYVNPHAWGSPLFRAFEFGYYLQERGLTLGEHDYWESGRAKSFVSRNGHEFKVLCDRKGLSILRAA
jgi:hypothetical protein